MLGVVGKGSPSSPGKKKKKKKKKKEMLQHRAARFVLTNLAAWRRNHRDSITDMLMTLKWLSLENRRRHSRLILLFKFVNKLIHIPTQYLPVPSPLTTTRANHDQKFMQQYARTDRYLYSFLPRTIPDWNNLNIENLSNCII